MESNIPYINAETSSLVDKELMGTYNYSIDQLKKILYTKTINISLRTELIIYYRKNFLETILDKKDIKYYNSVLINDFRPEKKDEIIENPKYFKFF